MSDIRSAEKRAIHYQTGRGTLCSLDNDASVRKPTMDECTVTCPHCQRLLAMQRSGDL